MTGFIYKITNKVNGMAYIGQTRYTVEFRWRQHQHNKDNAYFHSAIRKYGVENFTVETLEECDVDSLNSREIYYIAKYNTFSGNGYNLTVGGGGKRKIVTDNQYDEVKELYLAGFSSHKIAELFKVDKTTIIKILKIQGVKIRNKGIHINHQEFLELVKDYQSGYSLRELAKRYDCTGPGLKEYLQRKGVDLRVKYSILDRVGDQETLISEYLNSPLKLKDILRKYHCSYDTFKKILTIHGIQQVGKGNKSPFRLTDSECLEVISMFNSGKKVQEIAQHFEVNKKTIYSLLKRYHVDYLTV